MKQVIKYRVLRTTDINWMEETVAELMKAGWKLQGGVSTSVANSMYWYFQAMTYNITKE